MKKITITNAYTWYNKGDAGILLGIVEYLKECYKDVSIDILSFTPEEDKKRYCEDSAISNVYSNVLNPHPYNHTYFGRKVAIIKLFLSFVYQLVLSKICLKRLIAKKGEYKSLNDADIIVVCGGGFLGGKKFDSFMHLFQIYINTLFGKKVVVMGTSIEPVNNGVIKFVTERVLKRVDYIYAREIITYEYLQTFMTKQKFELIPDMAFLLPNVKKKSPYLEKTKNVKKYIGITVRKWNFPNEKNPTEKMINYKKSLAEFMTKYIKERRYSFVFIPQVIVDYGNDTDVAKEIKSMLPKEIREKFIIIENDISPIEIKTLIYNTDIFLGTRMHSNIFATSIGVPTIAIAYEKKTNGIMHTVGLDDYIVEMNSITLEELFSKMQLLENNYDNIKNSLKEEIEKIRKEINEKLNLIMKEE